MPHIFVMLLIIEMSSFDNSFLFRRTRDGIDDKNNFLGVIHYLILRKSVVKIGEKEDDISANDNP